MPIHFLRVSFILLVICALPCALWGQEPIPAEQPPPNFPTATWGGKQFWSDELVFRGWRIQLNVLTGHYRLLDENDFRMAWGTFDQCAAKLEQIKRERDLKSVDGRVVILMHGLVRSRDHLDGLASYLDEKGGYETVNVTYASSRRSLDDHARSLARVIEHLDGAEELNFVCHSLGNLVVRRYLAEAEKPEPRWAVDSRIKRMVMLGPPNNGAEMARFFRKNRLLGLVVGPSGKELAITWDESRKNLAVPKFEFGIIAGGCGDEFGANPIITGDDDFLVAVEETKLPGARDFLMVPCLHGNLMNDELVQRAVRTFLEKGYFISEEARHPLPPLADSQPDAGP